MIVDVALSLELGVAVARLVANLLGGLGPLLVLS